MAIRLVKTLQTVNYTLYIKTTVQLLTQESVSVRLKFYQSQGHYQDDFLPIIEKQVTITADNVLQIMQAFYPGNEQIYTQAIEQYLVQAVGYYQGGAIYP